jgi:hypothetical protein
MNLDNDPTIEQLQELTAKCDDQSAHHVMWVSESGDVFIDPIPPNGTPISFDESKPELKIRYETSERGNGYVGPAAAEDLAYMQRLLSLLTEKWQRLRDVEGRHYIDYY